jgi:glycosyltransferase involved in cell wall biosynthesis
VALAHDWLTGMRGGERVLEVLAGLFPEAELYTLFHIPGSASAPIERMRIHTSFLQRLPSLRRVYRYALPLFPRAVESFDLSGAELVVSSSHCVAKGIRKPPGALHVCYCHTPMRYAWDRFDDYFGAGRGNRIPLPLVRRAVGRLRDWDRESARGVDRFLANSHHVADRILRCYGRPAEVIPPPVDTSRFRPSPAGAPGGHYLVVSALVPYKRVDVAVEAFRGTGRRLRVVGDGPCLETLRRGAGAEVEFLGHVDDARLLREYRVCRAVLMPGVEDAGIVPLEAMACGRPVIARNEGGVPEVIVPPGGGQPATGLLYDGAEAADLRRALERFEAEAAPFDPGPIRRHAESYDIEVFRDRLRAALGLDEEMRSRRASR